MNGRFKYGVIGLLVVIALLVTAVGVLAQEGAPEEELQLRVKPMRGPGGALCGEAGLEAAAEALGMTADELSNQLWAGSTLADLAEQAGVDLQTIRDSVEEACLQAQHDTIEEAVENGRLDRDEADWLLEGLDNGYIGGRGFGHGFGLHGRRGPGGFGHFGRGFESNIEPGDFSGRFGSRSGSGLRFAPQRSIPSATGNSA